MRKSLLPLLLLIFTACQKEVIKQQEETATDEAAVSSRPLHKTYFRAIVNGIPFNATTAGASQAGAFTFAALSVFGIDSTQRGTDGEPLGMNVNLEYFYRLNNPATSAIISNQLDWAAFRTEGTLHYAESGRIDITKYRKDTRDGGMVTGTFSFVTREGDIVTNGEFFVYAPKYVPPFQNIN